MHALEIKTKRPAGAYLDKGQGYVSCKNYIGPWARLEGWLPYHFHVMSLTTHLYLSLEWFEPSNLNVNKGSTDLFCYKVQDQFYSVNRTGLQNQVIVCYSR